MLNCSMVKSVPPFSDNCGGTVGPSVATLNELPSLFRSRIFPFQLLPRGQTRWLRSRMGWVFVRPVCLLFSFLLNLATGISDWWA